MRLALLFILLFSFFFFVSSSFVLCFVFPSLEFSLAGQRSVNLALHFINREKGDFSILMRDICRQQWLIGTMEINSAGHESQYLYLCKEWDEDIACKRCPFSL